MPSPTPPTLPDDSTDPSDDLQFESVEPATETPADDRPIIATAARARTTGPASNCAGCGRPITDVYFALRDKTVCPACRQAIGAAPEGSRAGRLLKATLFGIGAGLLGAAVWFAIRHFAGYEIGYVALLVGFLVGKAVRKGSGGRGGRRYQVLAAVITYCCIAANYMPDVVQALVTDYQHKHPTTSTDTTTATPAKTQAAAKPATGPFSGAASTPTVTPTHSHDSKPVKVLKLAGLLAVLAAIVFGLSLAAPFLVGAKNLLGLLIIGIAVYEAWKLTAGRKLPFTGPYRIAPTM